MIFFIVVILISIIAIHMLYKRFMLSYITSVDYNEDYSLTQEQKEYDILIQSAMQESSKMIQEDELDSLQIKYNKLLSALKKIEKMGASETFVNIMEPSRIAHNVIAEIEKEEHHV